MWGSEPTTTNIHRRNVTKRKTFTFSWIIIYTYSPLGHSLGYGLAIGMMLRSLSVGKKITSHVGFDTVRK